MAGGRRRKMKAAADLPRPLKEERAAGRKAETEALSASACSASAGGAMDNSTRPKQLMSKRDVRWYLAQKPRVPPTRYEDLKRSNPDLTPRPGEKMDIHREMLYFLARMFYEQEEFVASVQKWVREEMSTRGYVEVDDEWVRSRAQVKAEVKEGLRVMRADLNSFLDGTLADADSGGSATESDSDDDEEDQRISIREVTYGE